MADGTHISWSDATWNPITGCTIVSPGCRECYAMKLAGGRMRNHWSRAGLTDETEAGPVWNGMVKTNEQWMDQPLRWHRSRTIFVAAHSDLFHPAVPEAIIDRVFAVMLHAQHHRFQVLTKRPERMKAYIHGHWERLRDTLPIHQRELGIDTAKYLFQTIDFPLPNVWLGVSAEDQKRAEERIPLLLDTPAAIRFLSAEPLIGPIDLRKLRVPAAGRELWVDGLTGMHTGWAKDGLLPQALAGLDWVIVGGESGSVRRARPMHPDWVRSLRDQCAIIGAFHFKQWGSWSNARHAGPSIPSRRTRKLCTLNGKPLPDNAGLYQVHRDKALNGREIDGRTWDEMPQQ